MDEIDIDNEIRKIEELYKHYKLLYRKIALLCCSEETKIVKERRDSLKRFLKEINQKN